MSQVLHLTGEMLLTNENLKIQRTHTDSISRTCELVDEKGENAMTCHTDFFNSFGDCDETTCLYFKKAKEAGMDIPRRNGIIEFIVEEVDEDE